MFQSVCKNLLNNDPYGIGRFGFGNFIEQLENFIEQLEKFIEQRCLRFCRGDFLLNNDPYGQKNFLNNDPYKNIEQRCLRKISGFLAMLRKFAFFIMFFGIRQTSTASGYIPAFPYGLSPVGCTLRYDIGVGQNLNAIGRA